MSIVKYKNQSGVTDTVNYTPIQKPIFRLKVA